MSAYALNFWYGESTGNIFIHTKSQLRLTPQVIRRRKFSKKSPKNRTFKLVLMV